MGDISIIARRLTDGHVQYGWSGNSGYYETVGARLLKWYCDPEKVEYLFGLGQLEWLGIPGSESDKSLPFLFVHQLTGRPHNLGNTERAIFSEILFIDYGYFYDLDNQWYYVMPGPFRIKIPLTIIRDNLDERGYEFEFRDYIESELLKYIFEEYPGEDEEFRQLLQELYPDKEELETQILNDDSPMMAFFRCESLFSYFDDWVVVTAQEDASHFKFHVRKEAPEHVETINWK